MPKYRQLHTKIIDSFDFNEMPDDFTRVVWMLLILILDSEGRGIDNMDWIKSKMFPLRQDVTTRKLAQVFIWLESHEMIHRYSVNDRDYFYISTFKDYQSGTQKEAKSLLPSPPEKLQRSSREVQEQVCVAESESESESESMAETNKNAPTPAYQFSIPKIIADATGLSAFPPKQYDRIEQIQCLLDVHGQEKVTQAFKNQYQKWTHTKSKDGRYYNGLNFAWIDWAQAELDTQVIVKPFNEMTGQEMLEWVRTHPEA